MDEDDCGGGGVEGGEQEGTNSLFQFDWIPSNPLSTPEPVPSPAETQTEGQELYLHFFHEQLRSQGLGEVAVQEEAGYGMIWKMAVILDRILPKEINP